MLKSIVKSKMALIAGLVALSAGGASLAAPVTIDGGTSATVDGWQIAPDEGITLQVDVGSNGNIAITKTADFTSIDALGIQFTEVNTPGDVGFEITTETIKNSTGDNWAGFTFSLSSPARFEGLTGVFIPPIGTGVNYTTVQLNAQRTTAFYSGTQQKGSTSSWGDPANDDLLAFSAPIAAPPAHTTFTLTEVPLRGISDGAVPLPTAAWQTLATLALLGLIAGGCKLKPVIAR
jgi:hypothetical protein